MNTNHLQADAVSLAERVEKSAVAEVESAGEAANQIRKKSEAVIDATRAKVCEDPMSCVVGAAVFGFALGCLVMCGRRSHSPQQRSANRTLEHANDLASKVSDKFSRAASNFRSW